MSDAFFLSLFSILLLFILIAYFITAKGRKQQISLVNSTGKTIQLDCEIADNSLLRAKGLMGRVSLGANEGMLFVFSKADRYGFWMFNTSIAIEAIHFSDDGDVVDILTMKPYSMDKRLPKEPSKYVLEVVSGFSKKNGIAVGKSRLAELL